MSTSLQDPGEAAGLTSFGFLTEEDHSSESQYGIGHLLSKVKTVFTGSAPSPWSATDRSPALQYPSTTRSEADAGTYDTLNMQRGDQRHQERQLGNTGPLEPHNHTLDRVVTVANSQHAPTSLIASTLGPPSPSAPIKKAQRVGFPTRTLAAKKSSAPHLPSALRTSTAAPAVISLAPAVVVAHQGGDDSFLARGGHDEPRAINDDIHQISGRLAPESSVATLVSHVRLPSASIPGFPLSKELLADDAQSNWSISSRSPGSDIGLDTTTGRSSSASLQTSAEAFRRLNIKGRASHSKEWWMPDESAKECSSCGSQFGIARRRHHCRCCGQIFCSKCASNLLPGNTLGLQGIVRVCDFCTRMMKQYDLARASGRGSPIDPTSASGNVRVRAEMISAPLEAAVENAPQSRFAANALFGATSFTRDGSQSPTGQSPSHPSSRPALNTISSSESIDFHPSRSQTPEFTALSSPRNENARHTGSGMEAQAPFRRGLAEEDHVPESEAAAGNTTVDAAAKQEEEDGISSSPPSITVGRTDTPAPPFKAVPATSSIDFPSTSQGSPSKAVARNALDQARARLASDASISQESRARLVSDAAIKAFRRSRLRSRMNTNEGLMEKSYSTSALSREDAYQSDSRPSSRLGSGSAQGLERDSLEYLRRLLDQCLSRAEIDNEEEWMNILLPLALRVIQSVRPAPTSRGKSMGVRRLVKIKRIAGGKPIDSHAIDGYICSRNVASKAMMRRLPLHNARVAMLSFPLTATKGEGYYVSLDALAASEREFTRIMVARVLSLRPHLLIVRDQVSRMALDILEQAGIVVVWKVPESSMASIARVTQTEIVTSLDRLALRPRLGRCGLFAVDTYHSMMLPGKRRSFLRFTGTPKELGSSIILRGGGQLHLAKIKAILEFCLLAAHNLQLEEAMRNVDLALLPESRGVKDAIGDAEKCTQPEILQTSQTECATRTDQEVNAEEEANAQVVSALKDYRSTLFSISARLEIPPPYPLMRLKKEQAVLNDLELQLQSCEDTENDNALQSVPPLSLISSDEKAVDSLSNQKQEGFPSTETETESESGQAAVIKQSPPVEYDVATLLREPSAVASSRQERPQLSLDEKMSIEMQIQTILPSSAAMSLQTRFAVARSRHAFDVRFLPSLIGLDKASLTPFSHQRLAVLHSFINSATLKPCTGPRIEQMYFYGREDHTLGDFLSSKCAGSSQICMAKNCGLQQILHYDSFIHHQIRIQCFCERFVCPIAGQELSILTWEYCKVCETATPVSVVNDTAKAYSWAKFLEAHFYIRQTRSSCSHESLLDRIRYFAYKNLAFRVHVEQVEPFDVVVPGLRLFMRPDIQSTLKAEESLGFARRADAYFHSVEARLKALQHEIESCRDLPAAIDRFWSPMQEIHAVALSGRQEVNHLLISEVSASGPGDTLCLNKVRQKLQGIVVKIDELFVRLERLVLPKEKDLRRLNANNLGRLFLERDSLERPPETPAPLEASTEPVVKESSSDGLPQSHTNNSLSALAMIADSAAFGLPTHLGISFEETQPDPVGISSAAPSGTTTPTTTSSPHTTKVFPSTNTVSVAPSPDPETIPHAISPSPSESAHPNDHDVVATEIKNARQGKEGGQKRREDSDGLSSPSDRLKPSSRPKTRKGKPSSSFSSTVTDSSCTEAGESTDGGRLGQWIDKGLKPLSRSGSSPIVSGRNLRQSSGGVSRTSRQQVFSDGDSRPPTRPTSPVDKHLRHPPSFTRTQSSSIVEQRTLSSTTSSRGLQRSGLPPPSSYRPPPARRAVRASESESDGPSSRRPIQSRPRLGISSASAGRPPLSRRTSAKSDSGNESQMQPLFRVAKRSGNGAGQMASLPPIAVPRTPSRVPIPTSVGGPAGRVSTIARHFDRINRHAEKERERQRRALALRARRALPIAASSARIAEYSSVSAAVESDESSDEVDGDDDEDDTESRSDGEEADSETELETAANCNEGVGASLEDRAEVTTRDKGTGLAETGDSVGLDAASLFDKTLDPSDKVKESGVQDKNAPPTPSTEASGLERGSLLKTISSFWASRAGVALPLLDYPLSAEQHLFADSPLLLREDEPSSTIAFTLVSAKYQERLRHLRATRKSAQTTSQDPETSTASWDLVDHRNQHNEEVECSLRQPEGVHLRFDFESGASRFHCRILFSEQFDALRRCCGCEDSFITSLARCLKWDSSGGKSGMTFLKTRDDRLVLKQLSSSELTSFSSFAPHYFAHMADCLMHGKPTTLAKIFGLFRISMRNQATGKSYKLDVLVMEHLFYGRQCSRIFDLKGSMRNRFVKETGAPGEVLQDENLVEISLQRPLFIREASKVMLRQALMHDSQFLAEMNIMDYSVIVGIDTSDGEDHELVVGIIDFLRSYTWDKRVETFVKEQSSLLGAAKGELPTVITPKQYAQRFLNFLDGIFLLSPDAWYHDTPQGPSPHNPNSAGPAATSASAATGATSVSAGQMA